MKYVCVRLVAEKCVRLVADRGRDTRIGANRSESACVWSRLWVRKPRVRAFGRAFALGVHRVRAFGRAIACVWSRYLVESACVWSRKCVRLVAQTCITYNSLPIIPVVANRAREIEPRKKKIGGQNSAPFCQVVAYGTRARVRAFGRAGKTHAFLYRQFAIDLHHAGLEVDPHGFGHRAA